MSTITVAVAILAVVLWVLSYYLATRAGNAKLQETLFDLAFESKQSEFREMLRDKNLARALGIAKPLVKRYPLAAKAHYLIISILEAENKDLEALAYLEKLGRKFSRNQFISKEQVDGIRIALIRKKTSCLKYEDAIILCRDLLEGVGPNKVIGLLYADLIFKNRSTDQYISTLKMLVSKFPDEMDFKHKLSEAILRLGDSDEADQILLDAQKEFPRSIGSFILLARRLDARNNWAAAAAFWKEIQDNFPLNAEAFEKGAEAFRRLGDADTAAEMMKQHPGDRAIPWPLR